MSPIEWTRLPGEQVEAVLGILLCRRYPTTGNRRRPASGDGGIDLYVLEGDLWDVFQVKGFTEPSLSSGQWKQIKESWDTFLEFSTSNALNVRSWHLVRPQNPTTPEENKLKMLVGERDFSCGIRGLDFCDGLAAEFPDVIDYYLRDGSDRLERVTSKLLTALAGAETGMSLTPSAVQERVRDAVLAVNDVDPHFRYAFGVSEGKHQPMPPPPDLARQLVASATITADLATVTVHVIEKYLGALEDRPIPIRLTPKFEPESQTANDWADFFEFGIPINNLEVDGLEVDLPGGLGAGGNDQARVSVGPAMVRTDRPKDVTLTVLDPEGAKIASVDLVTKYVTAGLTGSGTATKADDAAEVMTLLLKLTPEGRANLTFSANLDLTDKVPAEVLPALEVLAAFIPPNSLVLAIKHGMRIGPPHEVPRWDEIATTADTLRRACRALALIQTRCAQHIVVPDLKTFWGTEAGGWAEAASIIDKQHIETTWNEMSAERDMNVPLPETFFGDVASQLMVIKPLTVTVGGVEVHAGFIRQIVESARLADGQQLGEEAIRFVPAASDKVVIDWLESVEACEPTDSPPRTA